MPYQFPIPPNPGAASFWRTDPITGQTTYPGFDPSTAPNNGEGFYKQLGGNELPNAPHWTATITGDYTLPLAHDWLMTLHSDVHWQSQSWWRVFNDNTYDKLHPYFTMNLAAIFTNEDAGWNVMAYIKNVTNETAITGAFLNSDDTGLTTNVFLTEPRLYGIRVTKRWTGENWFGSFGQRHEGPYPLTVEVGGQIQRVDNPYDKLHAGFESSFPASINSFGQTQNRHLDWGDGREVKVTYRPQGAWSVSAGYRRGETNNGATRVSTVQDLEAACLITPKYEAVLGNVCDPANPSYEPGFNRSTTIWSAAAARDHEEHEVADFTVGRDLGLGGLRSQLSGGVRYASFGSDTEAAMSGVPDRYVRVGWFLPGPPRMPFHQYSGSISAHREFKGAGPAVAWDASLPLLGDDEMGHVNIDWSLGASVLFGAQETRISDRESVIDKTFKVSNVASFDFVTVDAIVDLPPIDIRRHKDATVPATSAALGLSYSIDRMKIGAGYRWERYFNVLDGGYAEHKDEDRTIDGPYFKIAVGFGG
jgi:hypothetical protein